MTAQRLTELQDALHQCVQDTTSRFGGIHLMRKDTPLSNDVCTVHTILEGNCRTAVALCADTALLVRLARNIMCQEQVSDLDVQDVAMEYFNVICGRITAVLYETARIASRFQAPRFHTGAYIPEALPASRCVLGYSGGANENAQLIFLGLLAPDQAHPA